MSFPFCRVRKTTGLGFLKVRPVASLVPLSLGGPLTSGTEVGWRRHGAGGGGGGGGAYPKRE